MIHVTSLIIGNSLVNEFEKRKRNTNTNIEYDLGIQFTSHPLIFFRELKQKGEKIYI